jgi:hypothetical protein
MEMDWWKKNNLRMVQLNLRETDARLDVPDLVRRLKDMDANALMMNTGGIVAFYPTGLDCHWRNPHLLRPDGTVRDLVGEVVTACHAAGSGTLPALISARRMRPSTRRIRNGFTETVPGRPCASMERSPPASMACISRTSPWTSCARP